jgi:hypothetical protein
MKPNPNSTSTPQIKKIIKLPLKQFIKLFSKYIKGNSPTPFLQKPLESIALKPRGLPPVVAWGATGPDVEA